MSIPTGFETTSRPLWQRGIEPVRRRLKLIAGSGLSARSLALTLCVGGAMGILPLIWGTALICLWLAHRFRLNHLVLQSVNYLLYPVQLSLLIPFYKLGLHWFSWGASLPADHLTSLFVEPTGNRLALLLVLSLKACGAWLLTVPPLALLVYLALLGTVVRRYSPPKKECL